MRELDLQGAKPVIIAVFGTAAELARATKLDRHRVSVWVRNNNVPAIMRDRVVKAAKKREFKITAEQLRGDL